MNITAMAAWGGIAFGVGLGLLAAKVLLKLGEDEHLLLLGVCGFMAGGPLLGAAARASRRADQPLDRRSLVVIGIILGVVAGMLLLCIVLI